MWTCHPPVLPTKFCNLRWDQLAAVFLSCFLLPAPLSAQEEPREENFRIEDWGVLKQDPRLEKSLSFDLEKPTVKQILRLLQQMTDVSMTAETHTLEQSLGRLRAHKCPAWEVMRQIVLTKGAKGGWTKSDDGYRLQVRFEPETEATTTPPEPTKWWIFGLPAVAVLLVAAGLYLYRSGASTAGTKDRKK
jgi:hypothetical protein